MSGKDWSKMSGNKPVSNKFVAASNENKKFAKKYFAHLEKPETKKDDEDDSYDCSFRSSSVSSSVSSDDDSIDSDADSFDDGDFCDSIDSDDFEAEVDPPKKKVVTRKAPLKKDGPKKAIAKKPAAKKTAAKKPATKKSAAKKRMLYNSKAIRARENGLLDRIVGLERRDDLGEITSWDIGETYMTPILFDVTTQKMTDAASVNLKWDRERDTIRCEVDMLVKFLNENPQFREPKVWVIEEQFDDSESLRNSIETVVKKSEVITSNSKSVDMKVDSNAWKRLERAHDEGVFKGPAMPVLETALRAIALALGKEVISILPRHVMTHYGLPCAGHDKNKALSDEFVRPLLSEEEKNIIRRTREKRDQQNLDHGGRVEHREHDYLEAYLQAIFVASVAHGVDYVSQRDPTADLSYPNRSGVTYE